MRFAVILMLMCGTAQACNDDLIQVQDWSIQSFDDKDNELSLKFASAGVKPIRMIDASAVFEDSLGEIILAFSLDRDADIQPGKSLTTTRTLFPNEKYDRLPKLNKEDVKAYVCTRGVVYEDGTKESFK